LRTSVRATSVALPQGPSLRSELFCLGPSTLNRPHPPHLWAHPDFTALRLIRDALAVRFRLGDPQLVPCFRWLSSIDMSSSGTPGSSSAAFTQSFADDVGLRPVRKVSALPSTPTLRFSWGDAISGLNYGLHSLQPVDLLAPLSELTRFSPSRRGLLLLGFRRFGHPPRRQI
jgi:hypothetical protein